MMKKFISKIVKFLGIIILFLATVNYVGDSAKLFHPDYVKKIAGLLINKSNVTNISNYDERLLQKEIISQIDISPDIFVLGSSRVKSINSDFFKDKKLRNYYVSGATLEDITAIYQMNISKRIIPKEIILGVDPWIFNAHNEQFRWKVLKNEYLEFIEQPKQTELVDYNKLKQLFSLSYFQVSLRNLPRVLRGKDQPVATKSKSNLHNTKLCDGSQVYGDVYKNVGIEVVNKRAEQYSRGEVYSLENFNSISEKKMAEFNKLIHNILDKKIKLIFVISPYHPIVFDRVKRDYGIVLEVEDTIRKIAKINGIDVIGSYDPSKLGLNQQDFYDGMHAKDNVEKKLFLNCKNIQ